MLLIMSASPPPLRFKWKQRLLRMSSVSWAIWNFPNTIFRRNARKFTRRLYVSSTTLRWPNKIIKIFQLEGFFHLPPVSLTPVANLELRISPLIFEKIRNGLNGILWGWGETEKKRTRTRSKKSRDTVPLKVLPHEIETCGETGVDK